MQLRLRKLSGKLVISLAVLQTIAGSIVGYVHMTYQEREMLQTMTLGADQLSQSIEGATYHAMLSGRQGDAYRTMEVIARKPGISWIRIFNKEGRIMYSTTAGDSGMVGKASPSCAVCHSDAAPLERAEMYSRARIFEGQGGKKNMAMVTPVYNEPSCSEVDCHAHPASVKVLGVLEVAYDLTPVQAQLDGIRTRVIIITAALITVLGLFILYFAKKFIDVPVRRLIEGTRAMGEMQLDTPVRVRSGQELSELASAFDRMRIRLRDALDENTRFTQSLETKVAERTEQLRVANQKLLQSYRLASLGQLSASVAHEINNPISGVLNLAMLLQRIVTEQGIAEGRVPEVKRYLGQIVNETSRVGRIVQDLLAFSRRSAPHRQEADINVLVNRTATVLGHKIQLLGVELELALDGGLPKVNCDPSQLQQVLFNLMINAAEAAQHRPGASVRVSTKGDIAKREVTIVVADNGEGIRPEHLSKIFDPFFTTKPEGKGVGLGLAVVYGIVDSHRGDIDAVSELGKGTTFTVTLPLDAAPAPAPAPVPAPGGEAAKGSA